jgi:hypothetical protein
MDEKLSRRDVLQKSAAFGVLAVVGTSACGKSQPKALSCSDTTSLSSSDALVRTSLAYVDVSTDPSKTCSRCQQFLEGPPGACGTCKVVKGPINPTGNCKSFLAKPA